MVVFGWDGIGGVAFGFFVLLLVVDAKRRKSVCMKSYQSGLSKDKFLVAKRQNSRNLAATLKEIRP